MQAQVTTMRYTRRFNVAQYEHEEITVDVVPAENQSADDLLAETRSFIEGSRPKVNGAYINGNGNKPATSGTAPLKSKAKADAPLKGAKSETENPTPTTPAKSGGTAASSTNGATIEQAPFDAGDKTEPPAKTKKSKGSKKAEMQAKMAGKTKDEANKEVQYVIDSQTVEELFERLNNLRDVGNGYFAALGVDEWEAAMKRITARYRQDDMKKIGAEKICGAIADAMNAEFNNIAKARKAAA